MRNIIVKTIVISCAGVGVVGLLAAAMFLFPAYGRYQDRLNAQNEVVVSSIEIKNTEQHVEIERRKAEVRVEEAKGIAESQRIIASSLNENYLQYLAIKAQEKMANSPNHTEVYIPSGNNGIPLVKNINPTPIYQQDTTKSKHGKSED
jgi:hypothetical protein